MHSTTYFLLLFQTKRIPFIWQSIVSILIYLLCNFVWVLRCLHRVSLEYRLRCERQCHEILAAHRCHRAQNRRPVRWWIPFPVPMVYHVQSAAYHEYPCQDNVKHGVGKNWMRRVHFAMRSTIYRQGQLHVDICQVEGTSNRTVDPIWDFHSYSQL